MTHLTVQARILRVYIDAVRDVFAPTLAQGGSAAEAVRLLLSLAEATVQCAANVAQKEAQIQELEQTLEELSRMLGLANAPPKLRLIDGGQV